MAFVHDSAIVMELKCCGEATYVLLHFCLQALIAASWHDHSFNATKMYLTFIQAHPYCMGQFELVC